MVNTAPSREVQVKLRRPRAGQQAKMIGSKAKRKMVRAGRRGGKTVGAGQVAVRAFLDGKRVLYATPTADQITRFWFEVKRALSDLIDAGVVIKNETLHIIEVPGTQQRIRAKTAWNADSLRGDYADVLILDEFQLMDETAWEEVGAPMLLDNDGDAIFIYTPPSLRSRSSTKARDPLHASKLFARAKAGEMGARWETFEWTSHDNPTISKAALEEIAGDMTQLAYRQEILAQDVDEVPGALWKQSVIDANRRPMPDLDTVKRVVVAVDPAVTNNRDSDEVGIGAGLLAPCDCKGDNKDHIFIVEDRSGRYSPHKWAEESVGLYSKWNADVFVAEVNNGGDMVALTVNTVAPNLAVKKIHASRGKMIRAEPIAALDEKGVIHHVKVFPELEEQMTSFTGDGKGHDDRVDWRVYVCSELSQGIKRTMRFGWT